MVAAGPKAVTLALLLLAALRGCVRHAETPREGRVRVSDSAGVTIVESSGPAWAHGQEWKVGALLTTIGTADGTPEEELFRAQDATRLSSGAVAVANGGTSEIRFFNASGKFLRSVGRAGEGPGEFTGGERPGLQFLTHVEGDTLLAWDLNRQALSVFSAEGKFIRSTRLRGTKRMYFMRGLFRDRSMLLALLNPEPPQRGWKGTRRQVERLVRFDSRGDSASLIGDFPGKEYHHHPTTSGPELWILPPWGRELFAAVADERVFVGTAESYEIAVYGRDGAPQRLVRKAHAPVALTDALASELVDRMLANMVARTPPEQQRTIVPELRRAVADLERPRTLPPYKGIAADADMNLWVREFTTSENAPSEWSVFAADGVWLGTVVVPAGLEPLEIGSDYVLGRRIDPLGVEHIEIYALDKDGAPAASGGGAG